MTKYIEPVDRCVCQPVVALLGTLWDLAPAVSVALVEAGRCRGGSRPWRRACTGFSV